MVLKRRDRAIVGTAGVLPGYRDMDEIGGGAFATVYRATETETGRKVALKILKVDSVHSHLLETFHQEIQALGKVSDHPNIVTLYRPMSTPDGRPVLVLELCKESLAQQVRRSGPLDPRAAIRVGIKIAGALETAHRHGFLHRDMKPQNILVTHFGEPALADFGVAALQASAQASAGVFGFTTLHAAPEMLEGHLLSPATDIYGLASTMYQLLTGLAPFAAFDNEAPASVILRIIRDPVRPLRSEGAPAELSDLLDAALAKDPEGRPATAAQFAESLRVIEASQGWAMTDYLVWGSPLKGDAPHRALSFRGEAGAEGEAAPGRSETLYRSAPSVQVETSAAPSALSGPPVRPESSPLNPAPPAATYDPAVVPASTRPAMPGPLAAPPSTSGPSIAQPEVVARNVVAPDNQARGQPEVPIEAPREALQPLPDLEARPVPAERPVFVDPGPEQVPYSAPGSTIYEETLQGRQQLSPARPEPEDVAAPASWWRALPAYVLVGGAAAAIVIALAIVLILGTM